MASDRFSGSPKSSGLRTKDARRDVLLQELLVELALTLLPQGVTPKAFAELARSAFAHAAAELSRQSNGKVSYSRIAAITGLSRADARKFLQEAIPQYSPDRSSQIPIQRVLNGWREDRRFVDLNGRPKRLKIIGAPPSFAHLSKLYGGDVPHIALLDELCRIGAVRRIRNEVVLITTSAKKSFRERGALTSILPTLIDGARLASSPDVSQLYPSIYRLIVPAKSSPEVTIVRERCRTTVVAMLNGLGESLGGHVTKPHAQPDAVHSFVMTILMTEKPLKATQPRMFDKRKLYRSSKSLRKPPNVDRKNQV